MVWILIIDAALIILFCVVALLLPFIAKAKINSTLLKLDEYSGRVENLHINLFAARINAGYITINKRDVVTADGNPFLHIPELIVYFQWRALLKKELDLDVIINAPIINIAHDRVASPKSEDNTEQPLDQSSELRNLISGVTRFQTNVKVHNALIRYKKSEPELEVQITQANVKVTDFSNHPEQTNPCVITINGLVAEGTFHADIKLYPLEHTLTLDLSTELKSINLVLLNAIFQTYGKVDVNRGTLDLIADVAVADNSFQGYLQPVLSDLDFIGIQDKNDSMIRKIWERIVASSVRFLVNRKGGQLATTIPIGGRLDNPQVDIGATIVGLVRNAFFKAVRPSFKRH